MRLFMLAVFAVALASGAKAGPDKTTSYLINTPASMLDLGIWKLSKGLEFYRYNDKFKYSYPSFESLTPVVRYDWDDDKIRINGLTLAEPKKDAPLAESLCKQWFTDIRRIAGINVATGKLWPVYPYSIYAEHFLHNGYSNPQSKEAVANLDVKFQIICQVRDRLFSAPLLGTTYSERK